MDWDDVGSIILMMIVAFWAFIFGGAVGMNFDATELPNGCFLYEDVVYCPTDLLVEDYVK